VICDARHATYDVLQVTVGEVQHASGTNWNQQQPNVSPALSSYCRSVVHNTLSFQSTLSAVPLAIESASSHRVEQHVQAVPPDASAPALDNSMVSLSRSRELSPCLDTSPVHNGSANAPRAHGDDVERDTTVECEVGHDGPEREEAAAAGIDSCAFVEEPSTATLAGNVSAAGAAETRQLASANTGTSSYAASSSAAKHTSINVISLTEALTSPSTFQDVSAPSQISSNTLNCSLADTSAAAVTSYAHEQVDEHSKHAASEERTAPPLPMAIKKLQLDKVRQESQVRETHTCRIVFAKT
jgi:hypothetical protein